MTDETLPPRFCELPRAEQEALVIAHHLDNKGIEYWGPISKKWHTDTDVVVTFDPQDTYRLAPEPEIPDSLDWSHVADGYDVLIRLAVDDVACLAGPVKCYVQADVFGSYRRGNMNACTVRRPGT